MPTETLLPPGLSPEQQEEVKRWEERLKAEGMPAELPPDLADLIENAWEPATAARAYARDRKFGARTSYIEGEHDQFARALAERFGLSRREAIELIEDEVGRR